MNRFIVCKGIKNGELAFGVKLIESENKFELMTESEILNEISHGLCTFFTNIDDQKSAEVEAVLRAKNDQKWIKDNLENLPSVEKIEQDGWKASIKGYSSPYSCQIAP